MMVENKRTKKSSWDRELLVLSDEAMAWIPSRPRLQLCGMGEREKRRRGEREREGERERGEREKRGREENVQSMQQDHRCARYQTSKDPNHKSQLFQRRVARQSRGEASNRIVFQVVQLSRTNPTPISRPSQSDSISRPNPHTSNDSSVTKLSANCAMASSISILTSHLYCIHESIINHQSPIAQHVRREAIAFT